MAVQRLHHHGAVLAAERQDLRLVAGDQRRRHQVGIVHHEEFFGRVAHAGGVVDHQRRRRQPLEDVRRGDVREVERRILSQQHDIHGREIEALLRAEGEVIAGDVAHGERGGACHRPAAAQAELVGPIVGERVSAAGRLEHEREGRVPRDRDALDRIHLHGDVQRHGISNESLREPGSIYRL